MTTPFGGFKQSGIGRELGPDALELLHRAQERLHRHVGRDRYRRHRAPELHEPAGVLEHVVHGGDDLVEHLGRADQRRRDLHHRVAAIIDAGDQPGLNRAGMNPRTNPWSCSASKRASSIRDHLNSPEEAVAADVADDRQSRAARPAPRGASPRASGRSQARRRARRSRCSSARSPRPTGVTPERDPVRHRRACPRTAAQQPAPTRAPRPSERAPR